jgi:hypothetical protein
VRSSARRKTSWPSRQRERSLSAVC